ncbi:hypothetical protein HK096_009295, partial [Nowakowskiella sp. JEL0078]
GNSKAYVSRSRLEFQLDSPNSKPETRRAVTTNRVLTPLSTPTDKTQSPNQGTEDNFFGDTDWNCVYATDGLWVGRLLSKPTILLFLKRTKSQIENHSVESGFSYVQILARLIDAVHPSHQLQATVLSYPLSASQIIRRRLLLLGYDIEWKETKQVMPATGVAGILNAVSSIVDDALAGNTSTIDLKTALNIVAALIARLETEFRFYFEFASPDRCNWRVGLAVYRSIVFQDHDKYPGHNTESFGFASDGKIFWNGKQYDYIEDPQDPLIFLGFRTWGIFVDFSVGNISLVIDGKLQKPAFGYGSSVFTTSEIEYQIKMITSRLLIPFFALKASEDLLASFGEIPHIKVNFGSSPFTYTIDANSCESLVKPKSFKSNSLESFSIIEALGTENNRDKIEDDKMQM